jgi:hypothetical protein
MWFSCYATGYEVPTIEMNWLWDVIGLTDMVSRVCKDLNDTLLHVTDDRQRYLVCGWLHEQSVEPFGSSTISESWAGRSRLHLADHRLNIIWRTLNSTSKYARQHNAYLLYCLFFRSYRTWAHLKCPLPIGLLLFSIASLAFKVVLCFEKTPLCPTMTQHARLLKGLYVYGEG